MLHYALRAGLKEIIIMRRNYFRNFMLILREEYYHAKNQRREDDHSSLVTIPSDCSGSTSNFLLMTTEKSLLKSRL